MCTPSCLSEQVVFNSFLEELLSVSAKELFICSSLCNQQSEVMERGQPMLPKFTVHSAHNNFILGGTSKNSFEHEQIN